MSIYKAYDIRGLYPKEIEEKTAYKIAQAFVKFLNAKTLAMGRDMRESSPSLFDAAVNGALDAGADVIGIGMSTTPMSYFATAHLGTDGGMMVTASHNPGEYNGFKLCGREAAPVSGDEGIRRIEEWVNADQLPGKAGKRGTFREENVTEAYCRHLKQFGPEITECKVAVDAANGMGGPFVEKILAEFPQVELVPLYFELDGTFPNHEANPLKPENLKDLRKLLKDSGADVGVALDGDADRCIFLDEKGSTVPSDLVTALLATEILEEEKGAVVYDLRSSRAVPETIEALGGTPVRSRVGHSLMKQLMREKNAVFGGELSGHYYFRKNFYCDSALVTMLSVLNLVGKTGRKLSNLIRPLRKYSSTGEINFRLEDPKGKIKQIEEVFSDGKIDYLDGITVQYDNWWFNVRESNTEPMLRLNVEGNDRKTMEAGKKRLIAILGEPE